MSQAARQLRILRSVENHEEGYFRGVMRGDRGPIAESEKSLIRIMEQELREITGDTSITLPEFHAMCRNVRRQAALN